MVLPILISCQRLSVNSCPPLIIPSEQALMDIDSIQTEKPALYEYIDAIGIRETFIADGCR